MSAGDARVTAGLIIVCFDVCKYLDIFVQHTCQEMYLGLEQVIVTSSTASVSIMSPTRTHATDKIEG